MCKVSERRQGNGAVTTSTTFVQAGDKVGRRSGQIRLYRAGRFRPMRKAGALTAEALDLMVARETGGDDRGAR